MLESLKKFQSVFSTSERFFIEKCQELLYHKTIDSYRVKINNPVTSLLELRSVFNDWHFKKIKNFETVENIKNETKKLLLEENELIFSSVNKNYLLDLIDKSNKDYYKELIYCINILLKENENYSITLFDKIDQEILRCNGLGAGLTCDELQILNRLVNFLLVQILANGFSKRFIVSLISTLFRNKPDYSFNDAFEALKEHSTMNEERYYAIVKVNIRKKKEENEILKILNSYTHILSEFETDYIKSINVFSNNFITKNKKSTYYLNFEITTYDYFNVIKKVKQKISFVMDLINLSYDYNVMWFENNVLIIGSKEVSKARIYSLNYSMDGKYNSGSTIYEYLSQRLQVINGNNIITSETKGKIKSSIRYLRLGSKSNEIEQKFINYWIGLEYIFSSNRIDSPTFSRLKKVFPDCHCLLYLKRNLKEFHDDIQRCDESSLIAGFSDDLEYLKKEDTYNSLIGNIFNSPLLAFRAYEFKKILFNHDRKSIKEYIVNHRTNLEINLVRIYRIRNEIIHDAAIKPNIENVTSYLRYYLTFIISDMLDFFGNSPIDFNLDKELTLDDFFIYKSLRLNDIKFGNYELNEIMEERDCFKPLLM